MAHSFAIMFGFTFVGIFVSYLLFWLYSHGIVVDEFVTGSVTIVDVMFLTLISFVLVGMLAMFISRRN